MSLRFFEGEAHAKVYAQYRSIPPKELIERLVAFLREKYEGPLSLAVDLGSGSGQCAIELRHDFSSVLGTDISAAQISEASERCKELGYDNIKFQVSEGEAIPVADNSVQLITICAAAHWMDLPKVFEEGRRVLVKNGVFSILAYHLPVYIPQESDAAKFDAIKEAVDMAMKVVKVYFPPEAMTVFTEYADVNLPFSDFTRERNFYFKRKARIADILGLIRTYSPFQSYCKDKGENAGNELLEKITTNIMSILNDGRDKPLTLEEFEAYEFTESVTYFVLMARR